MTLAQSLIDVGFNCIFYINPHKPTEKVLEERNLFFRVIEKCDDFEMKLIEEDEILVWINDHLDTNAEHAQNVIKMGIPLVTFDDRGSGARFSDIHFAPLILDESELLQGKRVLRGAKYLPLNSEIKYYYRQRNKLNSIIVSMGGSDTYGVSLKVLQLIKHLKVKKTLLLGPSFENYDELDSLDTTDIVIKKNVSSLIEEFSNHDLAITGGGITPFEANASGLPCIVIASESFEIPVGLYLQKLGSALFAGFHTEINKDVLYQEWDIEKMSRAASHGISLEGTNNIVQELKSLLP